MNEDGQQQQLRSNLEDDPTPVPISTAADAFAAEPDPFTTAAGCLPGGAVATTDRRHNSSSIECCCTTTLQQQQHTLQSHTRVAIALRTHSNNIHTHTHLFQVHSFRDHVAATIAAHHTHKTRKNGRLPVDKWQRFFHCPKRLSMIQGRGVHFEVGRKNHLVEQRIDADFPLVFECVKSFTHTQRTRRCVSRSTWKGRD